jgi:pheromone shutdown protein TraB
MIPEAITIIDVLQLLVLPVLLPALVGLATRWQPVGNLPTLAKRLILAGLALGSQVLTEFIQAGEAYTLNTLYWSLFLGGIAILTAELAYQGWYKAPVKTVASVQVATVASKGKTAGYVVVPPKTLASIIQGK